MKDYYSIKVLTARENLTDKKKVKPEGIVFEKKGRYLGTQVKYPYTTCVLSSKELIGSMSIDPQFDLKQIAGKSMYRFPKLTLPRQKVNIINEKYGSKVIRDRDAADIAVISKKYLDSISQESWRSPNSSKKEVIKLFSNTHCNVFSDQALAFVNNKLEKCNDDDMFRVARNNYYYGHIQKGSNLDNWFGLIDNSDSGYMFYLDEKSVETHDWLLNNQHKLCWDDNVARLASEDSVSLTEESYKNVETMINSLDDHNRTMALEVMANSNLDKSHTFLALLFFFYSETMKDASNWNHVNIKTLRQRYAKYMMGNHFYHATIYDQFIKKLIDDQALTEFAVQVIAKKMFGSVLQRTFGVEANCVFTIDPTSLQLKEEFQKKVKREDLVGDLPF